MAHSPDDEAKRIASEVKPGQPEGPDAPTVLPPPVQEHLAQQLRATYQVMADKPTFLGDPVLPPEFDRHIARLEERERTEIREKAHNLGVEAVEAALQDLASGIAGPDEPSPRASRRGER